MNNARFSVRKTVLFSLLPLAALFCMLEAGSRIIEHFIPPMVVDVGMGFDESSRLFVAVPGKAGDRVTNPTKAKQFVAQLFHNPKPSKAYRIAVLGESSINFLNSDMLVMADKFVAGAAGKGKTVEIINAGGISYGSQRLVLIARELLEYHPDLAIIYIGNNEFEELEQLRFYTSGTVAAQQLLGHSALIRVFRDLIARKWIAKLSREHDEHQLAKPVDASVVDVPVFNASDAQLRMAIFQENLKEIVTLFLKQKIPLLIGTVPSDFLNPFILRKFRPQFAPMHDLIAQQRYLEARNFAGDFLGKLPDRHQSSPVENSIIREVAEQTRVPLVDMDKIITEAEPHGIPGETLFLDHCHLNAKGRAYWINAFENRIRKLPSFLEWQQRQ